MKQLTQYYETFRSTISKIPMKYVYFVLLLALLSFTVWTRVQPLYLPLADTQAEVNVLNFYEQQITSSISQQYPNLPDANKQVLIDKELATFVSDNQAELNEQVGLLAEQIRSAYQDENGQTYLLGIDPYHYQRQIFYELEYGMAGDTIDDNGDVIDTYRLAPLGNNYGDTFHASISALWHKGLNLFGDFTLNYSYFMVGVLMVTLTVLFAYLFFARELNPLVAIVAGVILATSMFFVSRTTGESSDTDIYVLLFPFLTIWLYRLGVGKTALFTAALSGFFMGMYSYAWSAWWFTLFLMTLAIIVDILLKLIQKKEIGLHRAAIFHISTFISTGFFTNPSNFFSAYMQPLSSVLNFKSVGVTKLWPNIQTTVAELNAVGLDRVIGQLGGQLIFILSILGTFYALYLAYKKKDYFIAVYLVVWWLAAIYTTGKGVRFILMVIFPFIIGLAYFIKFVLVALPKIAFDSLKIPVNITKLVSLVVVSIIVLPSVLSGVAIAQSSVPSMDDGWYNSLTFIRDNVSEDVIMTSWWDFGYWFRSVADRPVTFDGGTQIGYNAYWVGKALSTDEHLSTGIIRMLNCGQNTAFETLVNYTSGYQETIDLLETIVVLPKSDAEKIFTELGLPMETLEYTHCDAHNSIVVASGDMVGKASVWGHFGAWNFTRAEMFQSVHSLPASEALLMLKDNYGLTDSTAVIEYNAMQQGGDDYISPYPQLLTSFSCKGEDTLFCDVKVQSLSISLTYTKSTGELNVSGNYGVDIVQVDDTIILSESNTGLGVYIDSEKSSGYLASEELVDGMFANMYYLEFSECYNLLYTGQSNSMGKVMIWESDYSCLE